MAVLQEPPSFQVGAVGPSVNYFQGTQSPWPQHPAQDPNIRLRPESNATPSSGNIRPQMVAPRIPSQPGSSAVSHQTTTTAPAGFMIGPGGFKINPLIRGLYIVTSS